MGSSNVSEDGASERGIRFDNIVYYSMDEAIEQVRFEVTI